MSSVSSSNYSIIACSSEPLCIIRGFTPQFTVDTGIDSVYNPLFTRPDSPSAETQAAIYPSDVAGEHAVSVPFSRKQMQSYQRKEIQDRINGENMRGEFRRFTPKA